MLCENGQWIWCGTMEKKSYFACSQMLSSIPITISDGCSFERLDLPHITIYH